MSTTKEEVDMAIDTFFADLKTNDELIAALKKYEIHESDDLTFPQRLLFAQMEASGIGKDSNNAYHKYPYTDCDSMIHYGGRILNLAGLVLYPKECEHGSNGNMIVVKKIFVCETIEGDQREIPIEVPVVSTDRKQADDKASFGSQSSGLAYLMRDLLLIPRGDKFVDIDGTPKSSVSAEDDTEFVKTVDNLTLTCECRKEYAKKIKDNMHENTAWAEKVFEFYGVDDIDALDDQQLITVMNSEGMKGCEV